MWATIKVRILRRQSQLSMQFVFPQGKEGQKDRLWRTSMSLLETKRQLQEIQEDVSQKLLLVKSIEKDLIIQEKNIEYASEVISTKLGNNVESDKFLNFFKKPYVTTSNGKNSILVFVPKFIKGFQVGWLHKEDETYYIYELNQYSSWLGDVPKDLLEKIDFKQDVRGYVEGDRIRFDVNDKDAIKKKFGKVLTDFTEDSARITRGNSFDVIAGMIDNGCLPFKPRKVLDSDVRVSDLIKLRDYQKQAYDKFLETGAVGVFYPTGAGKSFIAMHCIETIKGKKALIVPTKTLADQWQYYIETYIPQFKNEITISTYQGFKDFDGDYTLMIYDEAQRLPANTFSRLSVVNTKYRLGLSASPHREDKRESYIFALTGFPIGLNWQEYMTKTRKTYFPVDVITVKYQTQKIKKVEELLEQKKTIIFCDSIELGKQISNKLNVPHVYGETNNRVQIIQDNQITVVSRVGDLGLSVNNLERIIEVDFLFGSRQQELQRLGRLMHSNQKDLAHYIIMTESELEQHSKRLWALREKGFHVRVSSK